MRILVSFRLYLPEGTSPEAIDAWLRFQFGLTSDIPKNSLADKEFNQLGLNFLEWEER